jgi:hypothetical protein
MWTLSQHHGIVFAQYYTVLLAQQNILGTTSATFMNKNSEDGEVMTQHYSDSQGHFYCRSSHFNTGAQTEG